MAGAGDDRDADQSVAVDETLSADGLPPPAAPRPPPVVVGDGRYELQDEVGRGGIGRVRRARDRRLDREIALKELTRTSAEATRRFLREARITARLQHPAIVPVHDTGYLPDGTPFYSMKLLGGRSFADVLQEARGLDARMALLPHVLVAAEAVAYAHSQRVVHRDLKPQNLLVGSFGETTVIDWGLAKELDAAADSLEPMVPAAGATATVGATATAGVARPADAPHAAGAAPGRPATGATADDQTIAGTVMGTPAYMPPEQARGEPVDERADVYALGAILYTLLTGAPPYAGHSAQEILARVETTPPTPLVLLAPRVPRDLAAIVERAMARERAARYPDARALAEDLKRFLTGQLVAAHGYSAGEILRRWLARYRATVIVAAVLLLALVVTGAVGVANVLTSREDARRQQRLAERRRAEADRARVDAERAQAAAEQRSDELMLLQARHAVDTDPTLALAWIGRVAAAGRLDPDEFQVTAAEAHASGVARHVLRGHTIQVRALRFVGGDDRLASLSDDGTVRVWDLSAGKVLRVVAGPRIRDLDVSPDGRTLAIVDDSGAVRLHTVGDGGERLLGRHRGPATRVRFLPRSGRPCSAGDDGEVVVWADDGTPARRHVVDAAVSGLAVSADDDIAAASEHGPLHVWRARGGALQVPARDGAGLRGLTFAPGPRLLAHDDGELRVWRLDGEPRLERRLSGTFTGALVSPRGDHAVALSPVGSVLLSLADPAATTDLGPQQEAAFSADGAILALQWRASVVLRRLVDGTSRHLLTPELLTAAAFSADGTILATGGGEGSVRVFALAGQGASRSVALSAAVRALAAAPGGIALAAGFDGTLRLIDVASLTPVARRGHDGLIVDVAVAPDGRAAATAGLDGTVRLWDLRAGTVDVLPLPKPEYVGGVAFSDDGDHLAVVASDRVLRVWSRSARRLVREQPLADEAIAIAAGPGGRWALGTDPGPIQLVDADGRPRQTLRGHVGQVTRLAFVGPTTLVSTGIDGSIRRWDLATGEGVVLGRHGGPIWGLAVEPQARLVATSSSDRSVRVTRLDGSGVTVLRGHADDVSSVIFAGPHILVSGSLDQTVRTWAFDAGDMVPREPAAFRAWLARTTTVALTDRGGDAASP